MVVIVIVEIMYLFILANGYFIPAFYRVLILCYRSVCDDIALGPLYINITLLACQVQYNTKGVYMNLDIIDAFLKVAEKGSLSKAASEINISQSALSKQMIYLEDYLHKTLLHRSFKGVSLTSDGEIAIKHFLNIKAELQCLSDSLNQTRPPVFGASPTIGLKIHQCTLGEIAHNILLSENIDQLIALYLSRKIDVIFLTDNEYTQSILSNISEYCFTIKIPTHIIVHKSSVLYNQDNVTISDICNSPCVFYNGEQLMFQILNKKDLLAAVNSNTLSDKYLFEIVSFITRNPEYFSFSYMHHNMVYNDIKAIELIDVPPRHITIKMHDSKYKTELIALKDCIF